MVANSIIAVAAVNDRAVLENCLKRSPDVAKGVIPLVVREGFSSAASAYNGALDTSSPGTVVLFAHQDVYLPRGYADRNSLQVTLRDKS